MRRRVRSAALHLQAAGLAVPLALVLLLGGCAAEDVGVTAGYDEDYWGAPPIDYDMEFDQPLGFGYGGFGYDYGGWDSGYFVGPPPWSYERPGGPGVRPGFQGPYHPTSPSHPMPSIPIGPRGPGMRGMPR